jgi:transcriptional regulator with XRE-family HTH domain
VPRRRNDLQTAEKVTPGQVLAYRLKEVRERRRWSQQQLSDRLAAIGHPLHRVTIAKIEQGGPRAAKASLTDVLALAAALNCPPLHLFIPLRDDQRVFVTGKCVPTAAQAREWIRGGAPLGAANEDDARFYFQEQPLSELRAIADARRRFSREEEQHG